MVPQSIPVPPDAGFRYHMDILILQKGATMSRIARLCILTLILTAVVAVSGCSGSGDITYVPDGGSYTSDELSAMAAGLKEPSASGRPVSEASELRQAVLTRLRGDEETRPLADLLTKAFPADGRSVPYYAELGAVNGRAAWIVVEVWGSAGGTLDKRRVWAFSTDTGDVIVSTVF